MLLILANCILDSFKKCKNKIVDTDGIKKHYQNLYKNKLIDESEKNELIGDLNQLEKIQNYQFINCIKNN